MGKYLDGTGLQHFMSLIKTALSGKADASHTHSYLPLSGGTLTGHTYLDAKHIYHDSSSIDIDDTTLPSSQTWGNSRVYFRDKDDATIGQIAPVRQTDGTYGLVVGPTGNYLYLRTDGTNPSVYMTPASATEWLRALGISGASDKLNTIQSTSGQVVLTSTNNLLRLVLTTENNLRVDTRATTSDSWATLYYVGVAPSTVTTVSSIITQTSTQSTNNPISGATYYRHGATVMLEVRFKPAAARSAGTSISLGTIVSGKRPHQFASGGSQNIMGRITAAGDLQVVVRTALTANTEYTLGFTYLL